MRIIMLYSGSMPLAIYKATFFFTLSFNNLGSWGTVIACISGTNMYESYSS